MTLTVQDRILGSRGKMLELQSQWSFISFSFSLQGVCLGMQLAVVEFSRNVLEWQDANSAECDPKTNYPMLIEKPEQNTGHKGTAMRPGKQKTMCQIKNSVMRKLWRFRLLGKKGTTIGLR